MRTAEYLKAVCGEMGIDAHIEEFEVDMAEVSEAVFTVDGKDICRKTLIGVEKP